jgi:protein phosphatase PTC7
VLIAASDGVLDNLFDMELQACVSEQLKVLTGADPVAAQDALSCLADSIAERACAVGLRKNDPALNTPWKQESKKEGRVAQGGKLDDVAIVCGVVREGERPLGLRVSHNFDGETDRQMCPSAPNAPMWMQPATARGRVVPTQPTTARSIYID